MSYLNLKGKQVWGSAIYRLDLNTSSKRFTSDFNGVLTLYERRHEVASKKFDSVTEFIDYMQEFWNTALPNAKIQETRVARWLEEYFTELGLRISFDEALDAMRGQIEEVQELEVSQEKKLTQDQVINFIEKPENFAVTGITKSIKGDLTDITGIDRVLSKFLEDNKQIRNSQSKSKISYKDSNNQERTMNEARGVIDPILNEGVSLMTGFSNTFSETITDIIVEDIIPFSVSVLQSVPDPICKKIEETITDEGLKFIWKVDQLEPGEKFRIDYSLEHRMLRTILIRDDNDITLLHTYEDITKEGRDVWIDCRYTFKEKTETLENVVILDQIPNLYQFSSSSPEAVLPMGEVLHYSTGTEIKWKHADVPVNTQFVVTYDLKENPRLYRDIISIHDANDTQIAQVIKLVQPLKKQSGYGVIFSLLALDTIEELNLIDRVGVDFSITAIHADSGNIEDEKGEKMSRVKWKVNDLKNGDMVQAFFRYVGEGTYDLSQFNVLVPNKTSIIVEQELSQKSDKIILPEIYEVEVDK